MAIGERVPMLDAAQRVSGRVDYVLNVELPGMLWAKLLRSPHPHARIARVDVSRAARVPGVVAVVSRDDVLGWPGLSPYYGPLIQDTPMLALDRVRFAGEPVVAVAARDEDAAEEALDLVEVEYEPLAAVFEPEAALEPGAPLVHDQGNLIQHLKVRRGDFERAIEAADVVHTEEYTTPRIQHVPLEPHVVVAEASAGRLTIYSATQTPHVTRAEVARMFGLPMSHVRIIVRTLGGGFGGKAYTRHEPLVALLSLKSGRPVKLVHTRREEFLTTQRQPIRMRITSGARRDGTLLAVKGEVLYNSGAYAETSPRVVRHGAYGTCGAYRVPNMWVDVRAVYTNTVPCGPLRAPGSGQVHWARESHADGLAAKLGMDPLEFRLKNVVRDGDSFAIGGLLEQMHYPELLGRVARALEAGEQRPARLGPHVRVGRGYALAIKTTNTPTTSTATLKLNEDGSLNVLVSSVELGQGTQTALAQIAADAASVPLARISVSQPDTDTTPYDHSTGSSRTTFAMGQAVTLAAREVTRQLLDLAAEQLEVSAADLQARDGRVSVRGAPERGLDYGQVVRAARAGNIVGSGTFLVTAKPDPITGEPGASVHYHHAAGGAEVAVDTETGKIEVLRFEAGVYAGRMINPTHCELQTEGSVVWGLGQALTEEIVYEDGRVANPNLADYLIPSFQDVPGQTGVSMAEDLELGEVHGVGETAMPTVPPAIGNAIADAIGVRIYDLPITPEKVLRALEARGDAKEER
ncbi:MAG: xanthine dehydrogenase family protein molybdopterin-binding subunit [Chloroflexi bacterium]|nr:xanthine dehydrogenase family protein molybdopterin-binding subunit [Chloroflexota bacterium]